MKKLNLSEVSAIVGGADTTCKVTFSKMINGGSTVCRKITTCTNKHGSNTQFEQADLSNCN